jgi:hypothetical protein
LIIIQDPSSLNMDFLKKKKKEEEEEEGAGDHINSKSG